MLDDDGDVREADGSRDNEDAGSGEFRIQAVLAPKVTFASHQCDVAVIHELSILNGSGRDLENLSLALVSDPPVLGERKWTFDRIVSGSEFHVRDRRISLAGGYLDALAERVRVDVRFELRHGHEILAIQENRIDALARNEWGGANTMRELLAAFVMPNDPAVQRILRDASGVLEASGRSGAIDGYQSRDRSRSWELVSAIWSAVEQRNLTYAEPPSSFEEQGQKVRFPSTIVDHGLSTCLDSALLFASAIEAAGLNPLIVLTKGHALVGVWLQPMALRSLTEDDPSELRKSIADKELIVFETTLVTGNRGIRFTAAIAEAEKQIDHEHESAFVYALDIKRARDRAIHPLVSLLPVPATEYSAEGAGEGGSSYLEVAPVLPLFDIEANPEDSPLTPTQRLDRWKRSLLDLSKRNRLLNLRSSSTVIPVFCPDAARLEDMLASGKNIRLIPPPEDNRSSSVRDTVLYHLRTGDDFSDRFASEALQRGEVVANVADAKTLEKGTIELFRKARADLEEGGANTLFLALGMLRWSVPGDTTNRSYKAPLILLPVKLKRSSAASKPVLTAHEDDPVFNLTLLQMLRQDFQIDLPGLENGLPEDEHGVDVRSVWDQVRRRVKDVPGLEVAEEVSLSTFSFAKYLMWKDLSDRTETLKESPFVRHVIDSPRDPYGGGARFLEPREIDSRIDPTELLAPLNADSSQLVAIHASGGDGDFVLEGPPGTGKSETISNIIVHNLGQGRKVLFVSEKMAALEVVYRRLEAVGLGDFCLELHASKANKKEVLAQLNSAWKSRELRSEEEWRSKAELLKKVRGDLNRVVEALHKPGPAGLSPREAIGRAVRFGDVHRYRLDWASDRTGVGLAPDRDALSNLENHAKRLGHRFGELQPEDQEAFALVGHDEWSYGWASEMVDAAQRLQGGLARLEEKRSVFLERFGLVEAGREAKETAALADLASALVRAAGHDIAFSIGSEGQSALDDLDQLIEHLQDYRAVRDNLSAQYELAKTTSAPLDDWDQALKLAMGKPWPLNRLALRALRDEMRTVFGVGKSSAPTPERDLRALRSVATSLKTLKEVSSRIPRPSPWRGSGSDIGSMRAAIDAARMLRRAVAALAAFGRDVPSMREGLAEVLSDQREALSPDMPAGAAAAEFVAAQQEFKPLLDDFMLKARILEMPTDLDALKVSVAGIVARERRLSVWCQWVAATREAAAAGLPGLVKAVERGSVSPEDTVEVFRTAYACWLAPILVDARPELRRFSRIEHEDLIETFRALDKEVAELTADYVRAMLSGGVPARDGRILTPGFGVLRHELAKQKKHLPVRRLVSEMGVALTTLTPCLMMSPLSVAQFLPADLKIFDVVVFDEASQITVPDAIGAIARARRCVIVGDPKQMPPTRFFEKSAEDDENDDATDLESILDEAISSGMPHHRLTGHYRSRHESLITFSNHAYYDGSLITYPSADTRNTAVSFRHVDGIYAKGKSRTNQKEAQAVVAEVIRRLHDPKLSKLSMGIVTLNSEQQRLVLDLLDQERKNDPSLEPFFASDAGYGKEELAEPVFVKNLETVQGDQRDVILLSVGYGPSEPGARTMAMNFGPLNREGGERRLNVAITRATTEVIVFASFDSSMIDLTRTSAAAVRDLKQYLDFAARGPVALGEAIHSVSRSIYDSDFEFSVAQQLRKRGWTVATQIGVSKFRIDLGVVHPDAPGRFLAGVECDGASYHSSPTARDRDRVRHIILENLGWRLFRIWSTDFFLDSETAIDALHAKLTELLERDRIERVENASVVTDLLTPDTGDEEGEDRRALRFEPEVRDSGTPPQDGIARRMPPRLESRTVIDWSDRATQASALSVNGPQVSGPDKKMPSGALLNTSQERFYQDDYVIALTEIVAKAIDQEGPITFAVLSKRVASAHGFLRIGREIKSRIWLAAQRSGRPHERAPDDHEVFWPQGVAPLGEIAFRDEVVVGYPRDWRELPYQERLGLVRANCHSTPEATARAVGEVLGIGRVSSGFKADVSSLWTLVKQRL